MSIDNFGSIYYEEECRNWAAVGWCGGMQGLEGWMSLRSDKIGGKKGWDLAYVGFFCLFVCLNSIRDTSSILTGGRKMDFCIIVG